MPRSRYGGVRKCAGFFQSRPRWGIRNSQQIRSMQNSSRIPAKRLKNPRNIWIPSAIRTKFWRRSEEHREPRWICARLSTYEVQDWIGYSDQGMVKRYAKKCWRPESSNLAKSEQY